MILPRTNPFLQALALGITFVATAVSALSAPPLLTKQPGTVTATSGQEATFTIATAGTDALAYQWRHFGIPIAGANTGTLILPNVKMADAGFYDVVITAGAESTTSQPGRLMVAPVGGYPNTLRMDASFAPLLEAPGGIVNQVATTPDGSVYIAGNFSTISGQRRGNLARFNPALLLDNDFAPAVDGGSGSVNGLLIQADGGIVIWGQFSAVNGVARDQIARLNPNGTLDMSFETRLAPYSSFLDIYALAMQSDGKLIVACRQNSEAISNPTLVRLNQDGTIDPTFEANFGTAPGTDGQIAGMVVQSDDKLVVSRTYGEKNGSPTTVLVRLNANGILDASFAPGSGVNRTPKALALGADQTIYIGGDFTDFNGIPRHGIARILPSGAIDPAFNASGLNLSAVSSITPFPDGRVAVRCSYGLPRQGVVVLSSTGALDSSYELPPPETTAIATGGDNELLIAGYSSESGSMLNGGLAKYDSNGSLDAAATGDFRSETWAFAAVPVANEKWLISGEFTHVNYLERHSIARLNSDGTTDPAFDANGSNTGPIQGMAVQGDGKILVSNIGPTPLLRLTNDGALDSTFFVSSSFYSKPTHLRLLPDGRIVAACSVYTAGGWHTTGPVVVFLPDGNRDTTFQADEMSSGNGQGTIDALAVTADGRIAASEYRTLTQLDSTGRRQAVYTADDSGPAFYVWALDEDAAGRIVCAGWFDQFAGVSRNGFARLNIDGTPAFLPHSGTGLAGCAYAVAAQADGRVILGGFIGLYNGQYCGNFARLNPDDSLDTTFKIYDAALTLPATMQYTDDGRMLLTGSYGTRNHAPPNGLVMLRSGVSTAPIITQQPVAQTSALGKTVAFSTAANSADVKFWWYKNGMPIPGAEAPSLTISDIQPGDFGYYSVYVGTADKDEFYTRSEEVALNRLNFPIADPFAGQIGLGAASDGTNFLIGIQGDSTSATSVTAQLLGPDGTRIGERLTLGQSSGEDGTPSSGIKVAFDGTNYLLVWAGNTAGPSAHLYGAFVSTTGALAGTPFAFPKASSASARQVPQGIAFDGAHYLVVYSDGETKPCKLAGRLVSTAGEVGAEILLADNAMDSFQSAASNGNGFLVAWPVHLGGSQNIIQGRIITRSGALSDIISIDDQNTPSCNPLAVASDGSDYLVAWNFDTGPGAPAPKLWELRARIVTAGGTTPGKINVICTAASAPNTPALTYDGTNFLATWTQKQGESFVGETGMDIAGRYLSRDASPLGEAFHLAIGPGDQGFSSVATGTGNCMVIFSDMGAESSVRGLILPCDAPAHIIAQPSSPTIQLGATATLSVTANGLPPLAYQWYTGEAGDTSRPISHAVTSLYQTPPLSAWARYWVRITSGQSYVDSVTALVAVTGGSMTLGDWTAQAGTPAGQRGALDTPAGDGVTNLMKFALGVPPMADATAHLPIPATYIQAGQPTGIALLFATNPWAQGIRYTLEVSPDLITWEEAPSVMDTLGSNPDGTEQVRLREAMPPTTARRFARLKVEIATP